MAEPEPILVSRALTRRFGSFVAVDHVDFEVSRGEIFGYLGANGAGKSTTIRMLCGLLAPSDGSATVAGHDVGSEPRQVKRAIGYMSQRFSLYRELRVVENLEFFAGAYGLSGAQRDGRIERALELAGLSERRSATTGDLPGGIRQRLALASALLHEPAIVFLDEPTAGVDPASRRDFWRIIRELAREGTTVFVTTHHLDEAEYCGRVGLMVDGRLVALDTPGGLKRKHVPGTIHAVTGPTARALGKALAGLPEVHQIQPFGDRVRVRVSDDLSDGARFGGLLAEHGFGDARVETVEATLEDVFLELVGANGEQAAAKEAA